MVINCGLPTFYEYYHYYAFDGINQKIYHLHFRFQNIFLPLIFSHGIRTEKFSERTQ